VYGPERTFTDAVVLQLPAAKLRYRAGDEVTAAVQRVDAARASHLPALLLPYLGLGMLGLLRVPSQPVTTAFCLPGEGCALLRGGG
jgi:hypothetical protein